MKTKFLSIAVLLAAMVLTSSTYAEGRWGQNHPRRAEVNHRLANQNRRIDNKVEDGKMSKGEADKCRVCPFMGDPEFLLPFCDCV